MGDFSNNKVFKKINPIMIKNKTGQTLTLFSKESSLQHLNIPNLNQVYGT